MRAIARIKEDPNPREKSLGFCNYKDIMPRYNTEYQFVDDDYKYEIIFTGQVRAVGLLIYNDNQYGYEVLHGDDDYFWIPYYHLGPENQRRGKHYSNAYWMNELSELLQEAEQWLNENATRMPTGWIKKD